VRVAVRTFLAPVPPLQRPHGYADRRNTAISPCAANHEKPEAFYRLVEQMYPGSKVELFARGQRRGFVAHGNAVLKIDCSILRRAPLRNFLPEQQPARRSITQIQGGYGSFGDVVGPSLRLRCIAAQPTRFRADTSNTRAVS
jgi:hypothetical protein